MLAYRVIPIPAPKIGSELPAQAERQGQCRSLLAFAIRFCERKLKRLSVRELNLPNTDTELPAIFAYASLLG